MQTNPEKPTRKPRKKQKRPYKGKSLKRHCHAQGMALPKPDHETKPPKIEHCFLIEPVAHQGMTLYKLVFLNIQGEKVISRVDLTEPDMKGNTLSRMRFLSYKLYFEDQIPHKDTQVAAI